MKIIEYNSKYEEEVKDLLLELQEYIVSIDREKYNIISKDYRRDILLKTLEEVRNKQGKILLASENEKIVGMVIGIVNNIEEKEYDFLAPKRGRVTELIVSKNCRTKGIGTNLLKEVEVYLQTIGCEDILIEVFGYNKCAMNFYNKNNYHIRLYEVTKKIKESSNYMCKIASIQEINEKWDYEISIHPNENKWIVWKNQVINNVKNGNFICYYGILDGKIICEGTASFNHEGIQNSENLVGKDKVYLTGFRTIKEYQGKGYFSKLYNFIEHDLKKRNIKKLTLGVEPSEVKNIKIYFSFGFTNFIKTGYETYPAENSETETIMVNYYLKNI